MEKTVVALMIALLGIYFIMNPPGIKVNRPVPYEGFANKPRCPNILIQKGKEFLLFNSKLTKIPGVNPIKFDSLDEYTTFIKWQKSQGIKCPILFLQHSYNAQGDPVYKVHKSPTDLQVGLNEEILSGNTKKPSPLINAEADNPPFNRTGMAAYDPLDQYIGLDTPLDRMYHSNSKISANAMDSNWGGIEYTQKLIDGGAYKGDEVRRPGQLLAIQNKPLTEEEPTLSQDTPKSPPPSKLSAAPSIDAAYASSIAG